ncbi:MAG: PAS domain S-box protein [Deltaproteobacteria bacterium]
MVNQPLRILILEDNPADAELIQFELRDAGINHTVKIVMDEKHFVRELRECCPDLILSDYDLPAYNGALALAEANRRCPDTPFILITGAVSEDRAIEILTQGAKDYVLKSRLEQRLVPAVRRALAEAEEHKSRKKAEEDLREAHRNLEERVKIRTAELENEIAAREEAEKQLILREATFRRSFEASAVGMAMADLTGGFIMVNPAYCDMLGYTEDELLKMRFQEITHPEDVQPDEENLRSLLAGNIPHYHREKRYICKNGGIVWVILSVSLIRDAEGLPLYFVSHTQNITKRMQAEREQRLAAEIMGILNDPASLADNIQAILIAIRREAGFDAAGVRLRAGEDYPYFAQSGFSSEFLTGENTLLVREDKGGLCRDENGNALLECVCGLIVSGKTDPANPLFTEGGSFWTNDSVSLLALPADQDPRQNPRTRCIHEGFLSVALVPIRANGDIVGLLQLNARQKDYLTLKTVRYFEGIGTSIGMVLMRRQAEEALRESEEFLKRSQEIAHLGSWKLDLIQNRITWSDEVYRIFGLRPQEFGASYEAFLDHVHPDDRGLVDAAYTNSVQEGRDHYEVEHRIVRRKTGEVRFVHEKCEHFRDAAGEVVRSVGMVHDITERKRTEDALRATGAAIANPSGSVR